MLEQGEGINPEEELSPGEKETNRLIAAITNPTDDEGKPLPPLSTDEQVRRLSLLERQAENSIIGEGTPEDSVLMHRMQRVESTRLALIAADLKRREAAARQAHREGGNPPVTPASGSPAPK